MWWFMASCTGGSVSFRFLCCFSLCFLCFWFSAEFQGFCFSRCISIRKAEVVERIGTLAWCLPVKANDANSVFLVVLSFFFFKNISIIKNNSLQ